MQHLAWETVKKEQLNDKFWRKVVNGEKITAAQLGFAKGAPCRCIITKASR